MLHISPGLGWHPTAARLVAIASALTVTLALAACVPGEIQPLPAKPVAVPIQAATYQNVQVTTDVRYGTADGNPLLLDVCSPKDAAAAASTPSAKPAIIGVHGGSWRSGDKADWRGICQWLASEGFVAFTIDYRLAPAAVFPAQFEDVRSVVTWLREPEQTRDYNIDPARIGAFGGSAGGNLVALLGTEGTGSLDEGTRVAAVAELSGPADLTEAGVATPAFQKIELSYLGCASYADCPTARDASPVYQVDATDPPFFIAHSTHEFIPLAQATEFVTALRKHGVDTTFVKVSGTRHAVAMLNDGLRAQIVDFFRAKLGS